MDELILRALLELISCVIERPDFLSRERVTSLELVRADLLEYLRNPERDGQLADLARRKIKAFNLMLTAQVPVVRTLAERYLAGARNVEEFIRFLGTYEPK